MHLLRAVVSFALLCSSAPVWAFQLSHVGSGCERRWWSQDIAVTIQNVGIKGITNLDYQAVVDQAMGRWQDITCGKPVPYKLSDHGFGHTDVLGPQCDNPACSAITPNGNFIIAWQDDWPFSASIVSNTVVTANTCTGEIVDADIILDNKNHEYCVGTCKGTAFDLCTVLTHEMGHLLGLDHSADPEATMYATAPAGEQKKCTLTADDTAGLCALYDHTCDCSTVSQPDAGGSADAHGGTAPATPADTGCRASHGSSGSSDSIGWLFAGFLGLWLWRRKTGGQMNLRGSTRV